MDIEKLHNIFNDPYCLNAYGMFHTPYAYEMEPFYKLSNGYCACDYCDLLNYPFPYIKEFIDEVIEFRLTWGIKEFYEAGLYKLADDFIARKKSEKENKDAKRKRTIPDSSKK